MRWEQRSSRVADALGPTFIYFTASGIDSEGSVPRTATLMRVYTLGRALGEAEERRTEGRGGFSSQKAPKDRLVTPPAGVSVGLP